jgi:two-component system, NtrC family, sensor histidine kinase HydH
MDSAQFALAKRYIDFDEAAEAALREFHPLAAPHFAAIVDDFYLRVEEVPAARALVIGGKPQFDRLKRTLSDWLDVLLRGPYEDEYLEARSRIGRVHVRIGMSQEFMFTAMNRIRTCLQEVALDAYEGEPERRRRALRALNQILDLELTIMLDTYREFLLDRVRASERLATIGQLAASIGHELRNPLGTIDSSLFLLQQRHVRLGIEDPQIRKHQDKIANQVRHCSKIIENLLDLARDRPPRRKITSVPELVRQAIEQAALPPGVAVSIDDLSEAPTIDADADDLGHVIVNLLANAAQAQQGSGTIRISASRFKGGTALRVVDSGPGVPPEIRHRIFDALFTTRARGTGLGLALCRRILYAHGGEIDLEPSERGATFRIWVPDRATESSEGTDSGTETRDLE